MASAFSPWWMRLLHRVPGLYVTCPDGNYHARWDTLCVCCRGTNGLGDFVRVEDRWLPLAPVEEVVRGWIPVGARWWNMRAPSSLPSAPSGPRGPTSPSTTSNPDPDPERKDP